MVAPQRPVRPEDRDISRTRKGNVGHCRTTPWIRRSPSVASGLAMLAAACGVACGGTTDSSTEGENLGKTDQAIIGGSFDPDPASDAIVALRVGETSPYELCTGALVAPNVVLTARHCVSQSL